MFSKSICKDLGRENTNFMIGEENSKGSLQFLIVRKIRICKL